MRKFIFLFVVFALLATPALAAQDGPIAVVNLPLVVTKCEAGVAARAKLQKTFKPMQEDMDKQKSALEKLRTELQNQSLVLSQEAKIDKEGEFKRKVRDFQDSMQRFQRKYKLEERKHTEPIVEQIVKTIQAYGKKKGYSIIFDGKNSGVVYANKTSDITNEIIVEVNKAWRAKKK